MMIPLLFDGLEGDDLERSRLKYDCIFPERTKTLNAFSVRTERYSSFESPGTVVYCAS